ncbi:MAG: shikimate dehydrogenase [Deltaproteobacteria bacterium]|nr:shikimate dehydrogenase [Deltaproteobacteria bacterium]
MPAYVIGWPIEHSRSPAMLNAAFAHLGIAATMERRAVAPDDLAGFLRSTPALGMSVTIPHKEAALALADDATADARAIGAANCLEFRDGKVIAHNTDAPGFSDSLGFTPRRAIVLGAGGAARAIAYALRRSNVAVVGRRPAIWTASHAWSELPALLRDADLLVDCTSAELHPGGELDVRLDELPHGATVATLIYHHRTRLLERAAALGYSTLDGRGMLVHQGARALTIWTGFPAPIDVMSRALDDSLIRNA